MSRIRNVKPEFYSHEELQDMEMEHPELHPMLVFSGLWTQCEWSGVFSWSIRKLKISILPFLDYDIKKSLDYLETHNFIRKFTRDGKEYGYVFNFTKYQAISGHEKEQELKYPLPTDEELKNSGQDRDYTGTEQGQDRDKTEPPDSDVDVDVGHRHINSFGDAKRPEALPPGGPPKPLPEKPKKPPLRERDPVNDFERVEKAYLMNWVALFQAGKVKTPEPITNWNHTRKLLKTHFERLKPDIIIRAVNAGMNDEFVLSRGYSLGVMLSASVLNGLVNAGARSGAGPPAPLRESKKSLGGIVV